MKTRRGFVSNSSSSSFLITRAPLTDEQVEAEITRQIEAGRRHGGRFVMSTGSPVTPETPVDRVAFYCDKAREIGKG